MYLRYKIGITLSIATCKKLLMLNAKNIIVLNNISICQVKEKEYNYLLNENSQ